MKSRTYLYCLVFHGIYMSNLHTTHTHTHARARTSYCLSKMSSKSTSTDSLYDPVASTSIMEVESAESTEDINDPTMNFTEKYLQTYKEVKALGNISSKSDYSPNDLHTLLRVEELIDQYFEESIREKLNLDDIVILAESYLSLYFIKLPQDTEYEHLYIVEFYLMQNMLLLRNCELNNKSILVSMVTLMEMSNVTRKLRNFDKSVKFSYKAFKLYMQYTNEQDDFPVPIDIYSSVHSKKKLNTVNVLDILFIGALRSLIALRDYIENEEIDLEKIVMYMHKVLKKKLQHLPVAIHYITWFLEALHLAEYFLTCSRFVECKSHLTVTSVVIAKYLKDYSTKLDLPPAKQEFFNFQYNSIIGIIQVTWVKYGLTLLFSSRKQLLNYEGRNDSFEVDNCELIFTDEYIRQCMELWSFEFTEEEYKGFTYISKSNYITNHKDAKTIFVQILQLLKKVGTNKYVLKNAAARAEVAQYSSKAYKYIAFYENDRMNQIKLHKRRIEILDDCLKTLDEEDDQIIITYIWFELAIINSTIAEIKIDSLDTDEPSKKELQEINQLVESSKTYFKLYTDNIKIAEYGLKNGIADECYQIISIINLKYASKTLVSV